MEEMNYNPPDHLGAIRRAIRRTFTLVCGLCSNEESVDGDHADDATLLFLRIGWRLREGYLMCPPCFNAKRRRG